MTVKTAAPPAFTADKPRPPSASRNPLRRRKTVSRVRAVDAAGLLDVRDLTIPGGPVGRTWLRIFRPDGRIEKATGSVVRFPPADTTKTLPVVMYIHGDDAVFGNPRIRRPVTKIAMDLPAAVVVVDYSLSPKARYPVAIEESYAAAAWVAEHGREHGLDGSRIAVAADAAGAGLADELMLMADLRGGPVLAAHVLVSPKATAILRAALAS